MSYCTSTAVISEFLIFPQTTTASRYTETSALITAKIPRADATINSYIGRRYNIPFSPVPPKVEEISIKLTAFYTLESKFSRDSHNTNDWVEILGKEAITDLELIRDRKIDLVDSTGSMISEKTASTRLASSTYDYQPFADLDDISSWDIPTDRLDAIDRNG